MEFKSRDNFGFYAESFLNLLFLSLFVWTQLLMGMKPIDGNETHGREERNQDPWKFLLWWCIRLLEKAPSR